MLFEQEPIKNERCQIIIYFTVEIVRKSFCDPCFHEHKIGFWVEPTQVH